MPSPRFMVSSSSKLGRGGGVEQGHGFGLAGTRGRRASPFGARSDRPGSVGMISWRWRYRGTPAATLPCGPSTDGRTDGS